MSKFLAFIEKKIWIKLVTKEPMNTCPCIWVRWKHFSYIIWERPLSTVSLLRRKVWMPLILLFHVPAHQKASGMTDVKALPLTRYILFAVVTNGTFPICSCKMFWCNQDTPTAFAGASLHAKEALLNTSDSNV